MFPYDAKKIDDVCNFTPQNRRMVECSLDGVNSNHILYRGLTISLKDTVNLYFCKQITVELFLLLRQKKIVMY